MTEPTNQASVTVGMMRATKERGQKLQGTGEEGTAEARRLPAPESSDGGGEAQLDSTGS